MLKLVRKKLKCDVSVETINKSGRVLMLSQKKKKEESIQPKKLKMEEK